MNEELQKQIAEILKQAIAAAQHGGQWLAGQIPDVLQQLIMWNIWCGIVSGLAFVVVTVIGCIVTFKVCDQTLVKSGSWVEVPNVWCPSKISSCIASAIASFVSLMIFCSQIGDALKAAIAPKLFLLEYAAHLVH